MQNTKIQALWQLCQELKNRRETLVEKMNQNQRHLDEQQWAMNEEVEQLKHHNQDLFAQVNTLIGEIHGLQSHIDHRAAAEETKKTEPSFSGEDLSALHRRYTELANQLDVSESLYQSRDTLLQELQKTQQHVQHEFSALKQANHGLGDDLEQLQAQTHQLIELVENYRQAALEAYAEVEKAQSQQEQISSEDNLTETDDGTDSFDSKAEVARDAVRRKIIILLRQRLGKVPRDVNTALKEVHNTKVMDQLFELAITVEDINGFRDQLI